MAEKETIYSSKVKYSGLFPFADFYRFCYEFLVEDEGFSIKEDQYIEKIKGEAKDIDFVWSGSKKNTDYFKFNIKVKCRILGMNNVEVTQDRIKTKINKGTVEVKMTSELVRDYQGKFAIGGFLTFLRSIYEKWVIPSRISEQEDKLAGISDGFLAQVKSYLSLEGKR